MPIADLTARGNWWLPGAEDNQVTGVLRIEGSGIGLELDGSLEPFDLEPDRSYSPVWVNHSTVLGNTDIGVFTLLDVQGMTFGLPGGSGTTENYGVQAAIETAIDVSPPTFSRLTFSTDYLVHWIRPDGPTPLGLTETDYGLRAPRKQVISESSLSDGHVQLGAFTKTQTALYSAAMATDVSWVVTPVKPAELWTLLSNWVAPLQNLVSFATLAPNRVAELHVCEHENSPLARVHLELRGDHLPPSSISYLWDHKLVVTPSLMRLEGGKIVQRWMELSAAMPAVVARLIGREYQVPIVLEHYVSSAVEAAEGLHIARWPRTPLSAEEHEARVADSTRPIVGPGLRKWAATVLQSANNLPLRTRLTELVDRAREAGCPHVPDDSSEFCKSLAKYRNTVSHGDNLSSGSVGTIYWQANALTWLLRAILLNAVGVEPDAVRDIFEKNIQYQYAAHQVGWIND